MTSTAGGSMPRLVNAVQIWLRWSVPCCTVPTSRYATGAVRSYPSVLSTSRTIASGSMGLEMKLDHPAPIPSMATRSSGSDKSSKSTSNVGSPVRMKRSCASQVTMWRSVSMIGPRVPMTLVRSCSMLRSRHASITCKVAHAVCANATLTSEPLMTISSHRCRGRWTPVPFEDVVRWQPQPVRPRATPASTPRPAAGRSQPCASPCANERSPAEGPRSMKHLLGRAISNHTADRIERNSRLKPRHPPRGARLRIRRDIRARWQLDSDVERCRVIPAQVADGRHGVGEIVRALEVDREEAVMTGRTAQRPNVAWEARGPNRYPWLLNRSRKELHAVNEVMLAPMVDRLAGPRGDEDLQCFVEHLASHSIVELLTGL